ncbi:hypothetical protein HG537_0E06030 [Torulaspora globosa]|uniref:Sir1 ORC-binding domain-containing protein n=1 Tax=Torulaspora globosa TaxID=48254 RepID=A0A7H9HWF0_9SACH|nr:hypothetical protein HG537_0E06030 [Torulaspora sp. CBS 2947]
MNQQTRYINVDGYLLQAVDGETSYKIVSFKNARSRMSMKEREQFEKDELVDIDGYLSQESDLFDCTSKRLFEMIPTQQRLFWEQLEPRATKVVTTRTPAECKRSSTNEDVIQITYKANRKKFLRYTTARLDQFRFQMPDDNTRAFWKALAELERGKPLESCTFKAIR